MKMRTTYSASPSVALCAKRVKNQYEIQMLIPYCLSKSAVRRHWNQKEANCNLLITHTKNQRVMRMIRCPKR